MTVDARSFRVAIMSDHYVNGTEVDGVAVAAETGWGVVQLPAPAYPPTVQKPAIDAIAEHASEFIRHGYDVVVVGHSRRLTTALKRVGVGALDSITPRTYAELAEFFRVRALPPALDNANR